MKAVAAMVRGVQAIAPLWIGLVPFALVFGLTARAAGLSLFEAQLMSVVVFAGGAQLQAVGLVAAGSGFVGIVLSTFLVNLRHLLYGVALRDRLPLSGASRFVAAHLLTDEAFAAVITCRDPSFAFLLGAELAVFVPWNLATLAGACFGEVLPDPASLGVDFVFPLAFLAMLVMSVRSRLQLGVALLAAALAVLGARLLPAGVALLVASVVAALAGAWLPRASDARDGVAAPTREECS